MVIFFLSGIIILNFKLQDVHIYHSVMLMYDYSNIHTINVKCINNRNYFFFFNLTKVIFTFL